MSKCFYHSADLDGKCSAAIVANRHPEFELFPIDYGEEFPWEKIEPKETVFMVDFSLQPFDSMERLNSLANLIWIDHHKTAIEEMTKKKASIKGIQKVGLGACALVWDYLNPGVAAPTAIQLLAEYDVGDHSNQKTLPFQYGVRIYNDNDPTGTFLQNLINLPPDDFSAIVNIGKLVLTWEEKKKAHPAKKLSFPTSLNGLRLIAANSRDGGSSFFDSVWDEEKYDAMCLFFWNPLIEQWTVRLYTTKAGVDVGAAAKDWGGGGQLKSAGFTCNWLPFNLKNSEGSR